MRKPKKLLPEIISTSSPEYGAAAASVIRAGGVIAFPTETFYGLGADPFNAKAVNKIFNLKQRNPLKPLLVIIERLAQLDRLISSKPKQYDSLIKNYWPGPLTLIFPARAELPFELTGPSSTVGVRMSSSSHAATICRIADSPITATSANISGAPPARSVTEIVTYFSGTIDLIVDGGTSQATNCSTIIGTRSDGSLVTLRQGVLTIPKNS